MQHDYPIPSDTDIVEDGYGGFCTRKQRRENERLEMEHPDGDWTRVEYPEFFQWRLGHLSEKQKQQLMEPGGDMMILTPDCLDEFYKEPEGNDSRCPRCLSTNVTIRYPTILCNNCGYSDALIDYPISHDVHALFLKEML